MTFEKPGHTIYVLMVGEIPTLAFEAASQREAMGLLREAWLHDDLRAGRSNGKPLWDAKAKLSVRRATPEEATQYTASAEPPLDASGDLALVYLVNTN